MNDARRRLLAVGLALILMLTPPAVGTVAAADDDWPTYHHSADRAGSAAVGATFSDVVATWSSGALDGSVYAEPLYVGGRVLVATENNTVYAFDAVNGAPIWQTHLADPVAASELPCGNIRPIVGITGTPVIDTTSGLLWAAAMISPNAYELFAVEISSGN